MERKYAWDVVDEGIVSSRKVFIAEQISMMVTNGFEIKEMRVKIKEYNTLK
jgi:hypothetical protein